MALWGKTDVEGSKPKYLSDTLRNDQTVSDKDATNGVSVTEASNSTNIGKGLNTPGWVEYRTYTDSQGNTRNKSEVLVAISSITGDSDSLPPVPTITIGTQPSNASAISGNTASFTAAATITNSATLSYQWQKQEGGAGAWANVSGATSASYTTGNLTVASDNNDKYRVVVSGTLGAVSVNSTAATLTVAAAAITISGQPQDDTAVEGETASFSVTAAVDGGATLSYQWQKSDDTGTTWSNIVGATSDSYTTGALTVADDNADQYRVVVSATGEATPVESSAATLTVTAA